MFNSVIVKLATGARLLKKNVLVVFEDDFTLSAKTSSISVRPVVLGINVTRPASSLLNELGASNVTELAVLLGLVKLL